MPFCGFIDFFKAVFGFLYRIPFALGNGFRQINENGSPDFLFNAILGSFVNSAFCFVSVIHQRRKHKRKQRCEHKSANPIVSGHKHERKHKRKDEII